MVRVTDLARNDLNVLKAVNRTKIKSNPNRTDWIKFALVESIMFENAKEKDYLSSDMTKPTK